MNYLIKNASVVNDGEVFVADVLVADGLISAVSRADEVHELEPGANWTQAVDSSAAITIDAGGKYLIPGLIDEHVHFREPGLTQKADIFSESRAAVAGGVTSFMDMPNTVPQTVTCALLEEKFALAAEKSLANYSFYIGATNDNLKELLDVDFSKVCGIKLFMGSSTGNMLVDKEMALEALFRNAPCLIAAHCEDEQLIRRNTELLRSRAEAGEIAADASIHPLVRSAEACLRSTEYALELAQKTGARLHILHVSTAAELALLQSINPSGCRGVAISLEQKKITAETCPHYLILDDRDYRERGFAIKCNPAIKAEADKKALLQALGTGLIDTIGTDHAPHLLSEKMTSDYFTAKSGFPSIQHSLELMMGLVGCNALEITDIVRLMCHNPATLYRIDRRGFIRTGYHADLAIVDPCSPHTLSNAAELSKCGWTPYEGMNVRAKVTHTFVGGNLVYENGRFHEDFRGSRLEFKKLQ